MKLKFQKLIIDNFLSFGHAEINLEDRGFTLIEGVNRNPKDAAKSNGSGKSSIFNALCFALTGETIQGISSNLNNLYTSGDMKVQLDFSADDNSFTLIRSRDVKNHSDLKVIVNGVDKSGKGIRESQQVLEQYLPELSSEIIGEVIIIGQGMPHKFSANTPSSRKEILERLSHSDYMLEDIKTRVENRLMSLKDRKNSLWLDKAKEETNRDNLNSLMSEKTVELKSYENKPDFDKLIAENKNKLDVIKDALDSYNLKLNEATQKRANLNEQLLNTVNSKNAEILAETNEFNAHNVNIKSELSSKKARVNTLDKEIAKIKAIKDVCPMCGQKIPHAHKPNYDSEESEKKLLLEDITKLIETDNKQETAFKLNKQDIEDRYAQQETLLNNELQDIDNACRALQNDILKVKDDEATLNVQLNNIIKDKDNFEINFTRCKNSIKDIENKQITCNNNLLYIIKNIDDVGVHLDVLTKMSTLIKRDFRGILLTNIINYIDKKCKEYSLNIFGTKELSFVLNGNNIDVTYAQKPLESLSGGEQQKVDLIIQFAIRDMMKEFTGFTSNVLVLDEILDNLDSVGCDAVLNFISEKLSDIESIFIISHHADTLNIGNDSTITIVKNERGVSSIL